MQLDMPPPHDEHHLTPYEHYLEAERCLEVAEDDMEERLAPLLLAAAQVHATLATAAKTVDDAVAAEAALRSARAGWRADWDVPDLPARLPGPTTEPQVRPVPDRSRTGRAGIPAADGAT